MRNSPRPRRPIERESDATAVADTEVDERRQRIDQERENAETTKKIFEGLVSSLHGNGKSN